MVRNGTLDDVRHKVLADNTAQAVYKYLSELFREEVRFRSRWVWELLQNARDASPEGGVSVRLRQEAERVVFSHNGVPFTSEGIAHLIYHGTTKYGPSSSGAIGQFGTGFLTTHLISKTVKVKGQMEDGRRFEFLLDRQGDTADKLASAMNASWEAFTQSLRAGIVHELGAFTTEYEYRLASDVQNAVEEGINELTMNAAYILAFNARIRSIEVESATRCVTFQKKGQAPLGEGVQLVCVDERSGNHGVSRYVAMIEQDGTSVAIEIAKDAANWQIADNFKTPRIFVAFPLTATSDFSLPVVINSESFKPREDRDSLWLKPSDKDKDPNMVRMEGACDLAARLVRLAAEWGWRGAAMLMRLNKWRDWEWVDQRWLRELLVKRFIEPLRAAEVMTTKGAGRIPPARSIIPLLDDPALCGELWDLAAQVKDMSGQLPRRDEAHLWEANVRSWAPFLDQAAEQLDETLSLEKLCEMVSKWETVQEVEKRLVEGVDAIEWLNRLHALINRAGSAQLFEQKRVIPNQNGVLKKITELRRDPGIDEDLKGIAESVGLPTRHELLHAGMRLDVFLELQPKTQEEVLAGAIQKFKDKAKNVTSVDAAFREIAVRFFVWLVRQGEAEKLDGFPVLTRQTTEEHAALATLSRDPNNGDERLLAPVGCWPEPVRSVAYLFPEGQTLSDAYREDLPDNSLWEKLEQEGYLRLNPLYKTRRRAIPFIPDEPLPEKDRKVKHRTQDAVEVSALAFFEKDETGLDAVRRSKKRAVGLLRFLVNYVLEVDADALEAVEADCECGEKHRHYRAAWLVPMWDRRWVPLGEGKQDAATAETIAQLFKGRDEELREVTSGKGRKLLEALNISTADLRLRTIAPDEDSRISLTESLIDLVQAADNDLESLKVLVEEIRQSPRLLQEIREHRERREKVQRNQSLGGEVERLLKEALESYGLKVTPTGVGSDFEVEEDYVVDDKEVLLVIENDRRSFLVEVKATAGNAVRMTVTQAQTAVSKQDRFILCVVHLDSSDVTPEIVCQRSRFVMDIGQQIQPLWEAYLRYHATKGEVCTRVGEVELIVHDSEVRFAVGEGAWASGRSLNDAVKQILRTCRDGSAV